MARHFRPSVAENVYHKFWDEKHRKAVSNARLQVNVRISAKAEGILESEEVSPGVV
jgi:hypothetical protein